MAFKATEVVALRGAYQQVYDITCLAADDGVFTFGHTIGLPPDEHWIEEQDATLAGATHATRWGIVGVNPAAPYDVTIIKTCLAGPLGSTAARIWLRFQHSIPQG